MSDRVNILDPEFRIIEHDPTGGHRSTLRPIDLVAESVDYDELYRWVHRMNNASLVTLTARHRGQTIRFQIQPGSVTANPTTSAIHDSSYDRVVPDACLAMLGRCLNNGQAVCISLSVSTNSSSYIPVLQSVSV